jgi:hypothetical protein
MRKPTAPRDPRHDSSGNQLGLSVEGPRPSRSARPEPALDAHSHRTLVLNCMPCPTPVQ